MTKLVTVSLLSLFVACAFACHVHQVHISLADYYHTLNPGDPIVRIMFHTNNDLCDGNYVRLILGATEHRDIEASAAAYSAEYKKANYQTFVHVADVHDIQFDRVYQYYLFDETNEKFYGPYNFRAPSPVPTSIERSFLVYGDWDISDDGQQTLGYLLNTATQNFSTLDAVLHIGDIAYDLESKGGSRGDEFMEAIQPITAVTPYMVTAGNHEVLNNFSNFNMRFKMPQFEDYQNHLYSWNLDNIHFVSIDLELPILQPETLTYLVSWLENDLQQANQNRAERPWLIVYGHRPIWCSDLTDHDDCTINPTRFAAVEELLYEYSVDIYFSGHVHTYERNLPVHNGKVAPFTQPVAGDTGYNYIQDAQAPVYIVEAIPGHKDYPSGKSPYPLKDFCAHMDRTYSIGAMSVVNNTHLLWRMIHTKNGETHDFMYLSKTQPRYMPSYEAFLAQSGSSSPVAKQHALQTVGLVIVLLVILAVASSFVYGKLPRAGRKRASPMMQSLAQASH